MKPPIIFMLFLLMIALLAGRQFFRQRDESVKNDLAPVEIIQAEVKSKREYPWPNTRSRQREHIAAEQMRYEVVFQPLNSGADFTARLDRAVWLALNPGDRGELRRQGTRFVSFTRSAPRQL